MSVKRVDGMTFSLVKIRGERSKVQRKILLGEISR